MYRKLVLSFFKIGLFTFGGGYAMLPLLERELVDRRAWISKRELLNFYALSQVTPGVIAINTATFIGYKKKGILGAICATVGMILPSLFIILVVASVLIEYQNHPLVLDALWGIKIAVSVLILSALIRMRKSAITNFFSAGIALCVLLLSFFFKVSPFILVPLSGVCMLLYRRLR